MKVENARLGHGVYAPTYYRLCRQHTTTGTDTGASLSINLCMFCLISGPCTGTGFRGLSVSIRMGEWRAALPLPLCCMVGGVRFGGITRGHRMIWVLGRNFGGGSENGRSIIWELVVGPNRSRYPKLRRESGSGDGRHDSKSKERRKTHHRASQLINALFPWIRTPSSTALTAVYDAMYNGPAVSCGRGSPSRFSNPEAPPWRSSTRSTVSTNRWCPTRNPDQSQPAH